MYGSIPGNGLGMAAPLVAAFYRLQPPLRTLQARRQRDAEESADAADRPTFQVLVARDGCLGECPVVNPDVMPAAVVVQAAVVEPKVLLEQPPVHAGARLFGRAGLVCRNSF